MNSSSHSLSILEIEKIVHYQHASPRSVLGFHEITKQKKKLWVIRAMLPEAKTINLIWGSNSLPSTFLPLKKIHPNGLFELVLSPLNKLAPYQFQVTYKNGTQYQFYDPFYFPLQFSNYDLHLFHEGTHHNIYEKLGAHLVEIENIQGTLFGVWAPNAQSVSVVGNFNFWDGRTHPMHVHENSGVWEIFIPGIQEGELYKFEIKTKEGNFFLKSDPYGFAMELRPANASIVTHLDDYQWKDSDWLEKRKQQNFIQQPINIYEVHLGSWKRVPEENARFLTYVELTKTLIPYVKKMGYTHIELLPVAEHPLDASWGYQITGYFAPTSRFGSPTEFMYFIDCCHQAGIGVILDWVPGHFPKDQNGLAKFDGSSLYEHLDSKKGEHIEWGTYIFNYGRHEVKSFLISNALFWFDKYHIDGIRVDAVASMLYLDYNREDGNWNTNEYGGKEHIEAIHFLRELNETLFQSYPFALSIAEESTAWSGVTHPTYNSGLGFNLKWNMGWMNDTLRYISKDCIYRKYEQHLMTFSLVYAFTENFILPISHDEVVHGKSSLLSKMPGDSWQKQANFRTYVAYQIGHPGKKLFFMGNEFGQNDEWKEFKSLDWHLLEYQDHQQISLFCQEINQFYLNQPALYTSDFNWRGFEWMDICDEENSILSFVRHSEPFSLKKSLLFIFNFTPIPRSNYPIGVIESGKYKKVLDTDQNKYGGSNFSQQDIVSSEPVCWNHQENRILIELPPLACIVFQFY